MEAAKLSLPRFSQLASSAASSSLNNSWHCTGASLASPFLPAGTVAVAAGRVLGPCRAGREEQLIRPERSVVRTAGCEGFDMGKQRGLSMVVLLCIDAASAATAATAAAGRRVLGPCGARRGEQPMKPEESDTVVICMVSHGWVTKGDVCMSKSVDTLYATRQDIMPCGLCVYTVVSRQINPRRVCRGSPTMPSCQLHTAHP
jgi:hypothetical protein